MTLMVHPNLPGTEIDPPESAVPFHRASGWVLKGSDEDPEVIAQAEKDAKTAKSSKKDAEDKSAKASTKEGD